MTQKKTHRPDVDENIMRLFSIENEILVYAVDCGKRKKGDVAGYQNEKSPYRTVTVDGEKFMYHRVAFFVANGYWPEVVDHIDRNTLNNKISNLRGASRSQNAINKSKPSLGVSWHKRTNKWQAYVTKDRKTKFLGYFNCFGEALKVSSDKRKELFEEFYPRVP